MRLHALLPALLLLAGCTSTSKLMVGTARPALSPAQVQLYTAPPEHYQEIAVLETASGAFTYGEQNKTDAIIAHLKAAAAEVGANGVLLQETATGYGGSNVGVGGSTGHWGGSSASSVGVGISISPTQKYARAVAIWVEPGTPVPYAEPTPEPTPAPTTP